MKSLNQSFSWWCFANRGLEPTRLLAEAAALGFTGVDLIDEAFWPQARQAGLAITAVNGHRTWALSQREQAKAIEADLIENLAKAEKWHIPNLICFTGNRDGKTDEEAAAITAETLQRIAPRAEAAGVTLILELLNSKVDHPGYFADHTSFGVRVCELVNSPAVKLLYDIYHMQVMEGDIIRTIRENHRWLGHYHTAGNPGRGLPDDQQEIYYPAIYRAIAATGYSGVIAHEFLPPGDPIAALRQAYDDCVKALA